VGPNVWATRAAGPGTSPSSHKLVVLFVLSRLARFYPFPSSSRHPPFMPLPVAVNGTISLQGPTRQGDVPQPLTKRAMIIRMSEETLEALAAYPTHPPLQFEFGDSPVRTHPHAVLLFIRFSQLMSHVLPLHRVSTSSPHSFQCGASKNPHPTNFTFVLL
jgi:hypothetical protein